MLWAFTPVFLVANLVSFQPDPFDNVKMPVYRFLAVRILVAALLVTFWRGHGPVVRVLIGGMVATMPLSGILVNVEQARGLDRYRWATTEEIALAAELRAVTPPGSVFVVGLRHDHPIPMLSGRPVVMSFPGWIWTRGLDAATREADIRAIYALGPETPAPLARYDAAYVVVGPDEINGFGADTAAWRARYPVVIESGIYLVLDVR